MKVLMINAVCGIKNTGRICTDLAETLTAEKKGCIVKIAYGRDEVPREYQKYGVRIGEKKDLAYHALKARFFDGAGFGSGKATRAFLQWVKEFDPDVIHLHTLYGFYLHSGLLFRYLRNSGKKIVWSVYDYWPFSGHSLSCDTLSCEKWKTGCGRCPLRKAYPYSMIDRSKGNWKRKKALFTGIPGVTLVVHKEKLNEDLKASFLNGYRRICLPAEEREEGYGLSAESLKAIVDVYQSETDLS